MIPLLTLSNFKVSSWTFLLCLVTVHAFECENITGARLALIAWFITLYDTCDKSTNMPILFISLTTVLPKLVKLWIGLDESTMLLSALKFTLNVSKHENAFSLIIYHGVWQLCVKVKYLAPKSYIMRKTASLESMECPPSIPIKLAIFCCALACNISSTPVAKCKTWSYLFTNRLMTSICSKVLATESRYCVLQSEKATQNYWFDFYWEMNLAHVYTSNNNYHTCQLTCAPIFPSRMRGKSEWHSEQFCKPQVGSNVKFCKKLYLFKSFWTRL